MAPEILNKQLAGLSADVWSFGVLLFECVTGAVCSLLISVDERQNKLTTAGCGKELIELFTQCHQVEPEKRPTMAEVHDKLQTLVLQTVKDDEELRQELRRAQAQDSDTYGKTWNEHYGCQQHVSELLVEVKQLAAKYQRGLAL